MKLPLPRLARSLSPRIPRLPRVLSRRRPHRSHGLRLARPLGRPRKVAAAEPTETAAASPPSTEVDWHRNLIALWVAEFFAIFGFSFVGPFMPAFLHQNLGLVGEHDVAFWVGLCTGASGLSMAVASPIWGVLADRYGRRQMLLRAAVGGAVCIVLMGFVQSPWQLAGLRMLQGATSGTVAAATALVAAETPRAHVVRSLGVLSSSIALGNAAGPMIGGLAGAVIGLRWLFLIGGVLLVLSIIPVLLVVRETRKRRHATADRIGSVAALRRAGKPVLIALGVLIGGQFLMQFAYVSAQQLLVLKIVFLDPITANLWTGVAFSLAGVATAIASATYGRLAESFGFRGFAAAVALLLGLVIGTAAFMPSLALLVAVIASIGLLYGLLNPLIYGLLGLQAPPATQSTVYGVSSSAISGGMALGPLVAGGVAAASSPGNGLLVAAVVGVLLFGLLALGLRAPREPAPALSAERPREQRA